MIKKWTGAGWDSVDAVHYKNEPGTWMDVTRTTLFDSENSLFQTRYFEVAPGGYSTYEMHDHEHCVIVIKGSGDVRLGDDVHQIGLNDVVHVTPRQPHQFRAGAEPLGILCIVNRERDVPTPLRNSEVATASNL